MRLEGVENTFFRGLLRNSGFWSHAPRGREPASKMRKGMRKGCHKRSELKP
jgi:hypothetical protein